MFIYVDASSNLAGRIYAHFGPNVLLPHQARARTALISRAASPLPPPKNGMASLKIRYQKWRKMRDENA